MEGIERLLDQHIQDFMQILGGDWPDMPKEITVATACTGSAQDTLTLVAFQRAFAKRKMQGIKFRYLYNCENAENEQRKRRNRRRYEKCEATSSCLLYTSPSPRD